MSLSDQVRIARHLMNRSKTKGTSCDEEGVRKKKKKLLDDERTIARQKEKKSIFC